MCTKSPNAPMFPSPGVPQCSLPRPARAQQSHSPHLPFLRWVTFSSDLDTPPCPFPKKRAFSPDSLARQPRREWGKSPQAHLKGKEKTCPAETLHTRRLAPATGAAVSTQAAPPRPSGSLCGCPPSYHPRARPGPRRRSSPAALCHHHCITPAGTAGAPPGWETQPLGTIASHCLLLRSPAQGSALHSARSGGRAASSRSRSRGLTPCPSQHAAPARGLRHAELFE